MQWESNLIGYDALNSYSSPSYYAQCSFAEYLGSEVPTSCLDGGGEWFFYQVTRDPARDVVYLKLVNAASIAQPVQIQINGAGNISKTGTVVVTDRKNP
jgi:alpha-N-arabinofuranosidase